MIVRVLYCESVIDCGQWVSHKGTGDIRLEYLPPFSGKSVYRQTYDGQLSSSVLPSIVINNQYMTCNTEPLSGHLWLPERDSVSSSLLSMCLGLGLKSSRCYWRVQLRLTFWTNGPIARAFCALWIAEKVIASSFALAKRLLLLGMFAIAGKCQYWT